MAYNQMTNVIIHAEKTQQLMRAVCLHTVSRGMTLVMSEGIPLKDKKFL